MAARRPKSSAPEPVTDDEARAVCEAAGPHSRGVSVPVALLWLAIAAAAVAVAALLRAPGTPAAPEPADAGGAAGGAVFEESEVTVGLSLPGEWPEGRGPAVPVAVSGMTVDGDDVSDVVAPAPDHPRSLFLAPGVYQLALANGEVAVGTLVFGADTVRFKVDGSGAPVSVEVPLVLVRDGAGAAGDAGDAAQEGGDGTAAGGGAADSPDATDDLDDLVALLDKTKGLVDALSEW